MIGGNSKIYTDKNYKELKDLTEDDLVMDHDGEFVKIKTLKREIYSGEIYSIKVKYHPEPILIRGEKGVMVREMNKKYKTVASKRTFGIPKKY
jgi:hypothetical protein